MALTSLAEPSVTGSAVDDDGCAAKAVVSGTPTSIDASASGTDSLSVQTCEATLDKCVAVDANGNGFNDDVCVGKGVVCATPPCPDVAVGVLGCSPVQFTATVTNTGSADLVGCNLTDD